MSDYDFAIKLNLQHLQEDIQLLFDYDKITKECYEKLMEPIKKSLHLLDIKK